MTEIHKGEVGKTFQILTEVDLSGVLSLVAKIKKPSAKVSAWIPTVYGDPTLGIIRYTSVVGDLNEPGWYFLQAYGEFPGGKILLGNAVKFKVLDDFEVA